MSAVDWLATTAGSKHLPDPDVLAQEISDDLQTAADQFVAIAAALNT